MATLCTNCGTTLKDDARFCNNCGILVPSHPFSPKSTSSSVPPVEGQDRVVLREQIAQQPPPRSARHSSQDQPPSWMNQLDSQPRPKSKATPAPLSKVEFSPEERIEALPTETLNEERVDDLPTRPLVASSPDNLRMQGVSAMLPPPLHAPIHKGQAARIHEVEQLDTVPLSVQGLVKPAPQPVKETAQQLNWAQQQVKSQDHPVYRNTQTSTPSHSSAAMQVQPQSVQEQRNVSFAAPPVQDRQHTPPPQTSVSPLPRRKQRKNRKPLAIALIILFLLVLVGGTGAWIVLFQPFSMPGVTQPQQSFKDSQLGVSLSYPSGWQFQVDRRNATVHFYDSSHTAQVNLVVGPANGEDLSQYLKQQANQLGLTNQKVGIPLSFAGATWQQIQGSVQQRGASYTETIVLTVHNGHLFTLTQLAPQTTYASEEQLVFSPMRSSFQFM